MTMSGPGQIVKLAGAHFAGHAPYSPGRSANPGPALHSESLAVRFAKMKMVNAILPNRIFARLFEFVPSFQSTAGISRAIPTDGLLNQLLTELFGKRAQAE
jgi:hypothetical protein